MTNNDVNREIELAYITLRMINVCKDPIWFQDDSKFIIKKALTEYIDRLNNEHCETL